MTEQTKDQTVSDPVEAVVMRIEDHDFSDSRITLNTLQPDKGCDLSFYFPDEYIEGDEFEGNNVDFELSIEDIKALAIHAGLISA